MFEFCPRYYFFQLVDFMDYQSDVKKIDTRINRRVLKAIFCVMNYAFRLFGSMGYQSDVKEIDTKSGEKFLKAIPCVMDYVLMKMFTELLGFEEIIAVEEDQKVHCQQRTSYECAINELKEVAGHCYESKTALDKPETVPFLKEKIKRLFQDREVVFWKKVYFFYRMQEFVFPCEMLHDNKGRRVNWGGDCSMKVIRSASLNLTSFAIVSMVHLLYF